jgi:hypothetical protein
VIDAGLLVFLAALETMIGAKVAAKLPDMPASELAVSVTPSAGGPQGEGNPKVTPKS